MQEIIIYRNPIEAAFWHAVSGGEIFVAFCACIVFVLSFVVFASLFQTLQRRLPQKIKQKTYSILTSGYTPMIPALALTILTVKLMAF